MWNGLGNPFELFPDLGNIWYDHSSNCKLLSGPQGQVFHANPAFLDFIKYTLTEFTREKDPVTWLDLTFIDSGYTADVEEASRIIRGESLEYKVNKFYIPKNSLPVPVRLHVQRYPKDPEKDFEFFIVDVTVIGDQYSKLFKELYENQKSLERSMRSVASSLNDLKAASPAVFILWCKRNPQYGWPVAIFIGSLLFGSRVIELLTEMKGVWTGG